MTIRDRFPRPLQEVSAQITFARRLVVEFRADSFYQRIKDRFPDINGLPYILVPPPNDIPPEQLFAPVYRFHDKDGNHLVQYGPNLLSVNAVTWNEGFAGFRRAVEYVTDACHAAQDGDLVNGFSLGFYNRMAVNNSDDVRWLFRNAIPFEKETDFSTFSMQQSRSTKVGLLTTQISTIADSGSERAVLVNNIVNRTADNESLKTKVFLEWIERAHEIVKDTFWNGLSDEAQNAWNRSHVAEVVG